MLRYRALLYPAEGKQGPYLHKIVSVCRLPGFLQLQVVGRFWMSWWLPQPHICCPPGPILVTKNFFCLVKLMGIFYIMIPILLIDKRYFSSLILFPLFLALSAWVRETWQISSLKLYGTLHIFSFFFGLNRGSSLPFGGQSNVLFVFGKEGLGLGRVFFLMNWDLSWVIYSCKARSEWMMVQGMICEKLRTG